MSKRAAGGVVVLLLAGLLALLGVRFTGHSGHRSGSPRSHRETPHLAKGAEFSGKVVGVADGDTVDVLHEGAAVRIRLYGVDCPESHQAYGQRAKQFTSGLVFGETVRVVAHDHDAYGRVVGEVFVVREGREVSLNRELVKAGLAWAYRHYSEQFVPDEQEARAARRGLWADPDPTPPWEYRRQRRE